jgi:hypothetical protein
MCHSFCRQTAVTGKEMSTSATRRRRPLLLQTFWTGKPLSRLERAALQSYVNQGYTVDIYTYTPIADFKKQLPGAATPERIRVHDARTILPESALFEYDGRATVGARTDAYRFLPFSDLFRFTMLHKKGGTWIDLDIFLTRPISAAVLRRPYAFSSERTIQKGAYRKAEPEIVDMGFIKVPGPNSPLTTWILEHLPAPNRLADPKTPFDYMNLYRRAIATLNLCRFTLPAAAFLPLNWWDVKDAFAPGSGVPDMCFRGKYGVAPFCVRDLRHPQVYGVHWFRAILRKKGLPYEVGGLPETTSSSLYDTMVAKIERDAGIPVGSL